MGRPRQQTDRVTIQAVALHAGVSTMTVSNVFNRTGKVGEATRTRVLAAIEELGYVPNQAARRLVGSAVARIGLLYPYGQSMFIEATLSAIAVAAAEKGLQLLIRSTEADFAEEASDLAQALVRSGAEALLLVPPFAEILGRSGALADLAVPAAAIATATPLPGIMTVRIDNRAASYAITARLIARGCRNIAVVAGPPNHSDGVARLEGYRDALRDHGLPVVDALCVEGDYRFASGLEAAEYLLHLPERPDAIVSTNDDMAAAILWVAHRRGLTVPGELAVTGFDDTVFATRVWPPLTTVHQPIRAMAAEAFELLAQAVRNPDEYGDVRDIVLPFTIAERESG